jgi:FkbM family methyltransferase
MIHSVALRFLVESPYFDGLQKLVVDIGAADGCYTSNSHPLIHDHQWSAILVEPQEQQLAKARELHKAFVDRVTFMQVAVCEKDGHVRMFLHPNDGDGTTTCNHGTSILSIPGSRRSFEVPSISYESFVAKINLEAVGLLSIDAEGYDDNILFGLLRATSARPQCVIVESEYYLLPSHTQVRTQEMAAMGYHCIYQHEDQIFVHESSIRRPTL